MGIEPKRAAVFLNPYSGPARQGGDEHQIRAALEAAGLQPEIIPLRNGLDIRKVVAEKSRTGVDAIVAAGGDGTVSAVGSALVGTDTALGVLPAGTLNHFARDLGLPMELDAAARVIAGGQTTSVDVGEVNGRSFLNISSIGLYSSVVTQRERLMRHGVPRSLALARAALTALWQFPDTTIRFTTGTTGLVAKTPLLFVGNNRYEFAGLQAGRRTCLRGGILQLCTVKNPTRSALLKAAILALMGKLEASPDVVTADVMWARIETLRHSVEVALDGEVVRLRSPLLYSIRARALNVRVPARQSES